jgi:hypothetical protein
MFIIESMIYLKLTISKMLQYGSCRFATHLLCIGMIPVSNQICLRSSAGLISPSKEMVPEIGLQQVSSASLTVHCPVI